MRYELPPDFDAWKTGHWGEDDPANQGAEPAMDPRDDEPQDFDERRNRDESD